MRSSWPEIAQRYRDLAGEMKLPQLRQLKALEEISEYIAKSGLTLFGWTSILDLCVQQTDETPPAVGPHLRISPSRNGLIDFRYIDTFDEKRLWHRTAAPEDALDRFKRFLIQMHWTYQLPAGTPRDVH